MFSSTTAQNPEAGYGAPALAGDTTWTSAKFGSTTWNLVGGDFVGTITASATSTGASPLIFSSDQLIQVCRCRLSLAFSHRVVEQDLVSWASGDEVRVCSVCVTCVEIEGQPNYGWMLFGQEDAIETATRFSSREGSSPPLLVVTPPADVPAEQIAWPVFQGARWLSVGPTHTCALTTGNRRECWGQASIEDDVGVRGQFPDLDVPSGPVWCGWCARALKHVALQNAMIVSGAVQMFGRAHKDLIRGEQRQV